MAITNGYATLSQIKTYLSTTSTNDDARLEQSIEAASRAIDAECRRVFYGATATRYFEAEAPNYLDLRDDLLSITELAIDKGMRLYDAVDPSTYELEPINQPPYQRVYLSFSAQTPFPVNRRGIRINGLWGYNSTGSHPDEINNACLILAVRYFKRRDAAFGVLGTPELGFTRISARDPEIRALLNPFRRVTLDV